MSPPSAKLTSRVGCVGSWERFEVEKVIHCTTDERADRLYKAQQFLLAAETIATIIDDTAMGDAYVTLCVHAGIAAADVICCSRLNVCYEGSDHSGAIASLEKLDHTTALSLSTLLHIKTRSPEDAALTIKSDQKRVGRAAAFLVSAARLV